MVCVIDLIREMAFYSVVKKYPDILYSMQKSALDI